MLNDMISGGGMGMGGGGGGNGGREWWSQYAHPRGGEESVLDIYDRLFGLGAQQRALQKQALPEMQQYLANGQPSLEGGEHVPATNGRPEAVKPGFATDNPYTMEYVQNLLANKTAAKHAELANTGLGLENTSRELSNRGAEYNLDQPGINKHNEMEFMRWKAENPNATPQEMMEAMYTKMPQSRESMFKNIPVAVEQQKRQEALGPQYEKWGVKPEAVNFASPQEIRQLTTPSPDIAAMQQTKWNEAKKFMSTDLFKKLPPEIQRKAMLKSMDLESRIQQGFPVGDDEIRQFQSELKQTMYGPKHDINQTQQVLNNVKKEGMIDWGRIANMTPFQSGAGGQQMLKMLVDSLYPGASRLPPKAPAQMPAPQQGQQPAQQNDPVYEWLKNLVNYLPSK
jgi:hypothetical protein